MKYPLSLVAALCQMKYPLKVNMAMEHLPFEGAFPIEHGDFPLPC